MKATKEFRGVRPGEIYPSVIAVGEEIPEELEAAAIELGCVAKRAPKAAPAPVPTPPPDLLPNSSISPPAPPASGETPAS